MSETLKSSFRKRTSMWASRMLDGYSLRELVSAIYVDTPDKSSGKRIQHIHIKYDGLGFIPLSELMKQETV